MIEKNCRWTVREGAMSVAEFSLVTAFERPRERFFATGQGKRWSAIGNRAPVAAFAEDEDPRQNEQMGTKQHPVPADIFWITSLLFAEDDEKQALVWVDTVLRYMAPFGEQKRCVGEHLREARPALGGRGRITRPKSLLFSSSSSPFLHFALCTLPLVALGLEKWAGCDKMASLAVRQRPFQLV